MKKIAFLLSICLLLSTLSACTLEVPSILEAKKVVDAYVYYNKTGKLPPDINEILADNNLFSNQNDQDKRYQKILATTPSEILEHTLKAAKKKDILYLIEEYYNLTHPKIESAATSEYNRLVTWKPNFSGKNSTKAEIKLQQLNSINVVLALSYTNAKNFYLAMAAAVFAINAEDITAAGNFAAALAAFADDLILEGASASAVTKYYEDAEGVYHYALLLAGSDGKYTQNALSLLVSLGNLYLDANKLKEAYACFKTAMEINKEYSPAIEGLFNTYMALRQYKEAMELIAETTKYPAFVSANKELDEKSEADAKKAGVSSTAPDEEALRQSCDSLNTIESVSVADYLGDIDEEAKDKLNQLIRQVQSKMVYTVPDPTLITQFSSLYNISQPAGLSAVEAYREGLYLLEERWHVLNTRIEERTPPMDAPAEEATNYAMQYQKDNKLETLKSYYKASAEISPRFFVYTLNPYDFANPIDIIVQRRNLEIYNMKFPVHSGYLNKAIDNARKDVEDIVFSFYDKNNALEKEMQDKESALYDKYEGTNGGPTSAELHQVHAPFYPRLRKLGEVAWQQATQAATTAYHKKIKKNIEQMYNDCMKHIILVSDDNIRTMLEEELQDAVLGSVHEIHYLLLYAYDFTGHYPDCGCADMTEEEKEAAEEKERQAEKLANDQVKKNMESKKRFDSGVLDENSAYYKKIIKPYEVKLKTPFLEGIVGPYKSGLKMKFDLPGVPPVLEFSKMENHIRNTTTYNGGIEIGAGKGAKVSTYLKFSAIKGAKGQFAADDIDIIGGGKVTLSNAFTSTEFGMEASAVKGSKSYANFSLVGDGLLNEEFKSYMGAWIPEMKKELWNGEYLGY